MSRRSNHAPGCRPPGAPRPASPRPPAGAHGHPGRCTRRAGHQRAAPSASPASRSFPRCCETAGRATRSAETSSLTSCSPSTSSDINLSRVPSASIRSIAVAASTWLSTGRRCCRSSAPASLSRAYMSTYYRHRRAIGRQPLESGRRGGQPRARARRQARRLVESAETPVPTPLARHRRQGRPGAGGVPRRACARCGSRLPCSASPPPLQAVVVVLVRLGGAARRHPAQRRRRAHRRARWASRSWLGRRAADPGVHLWLRPRRGPRRHRHRRWSSPRPPIAAGLGRGRAGCCNPQTDDAPALGARRRRDRLPRQRARRPLPHHASAGGSARPRWSPTACTPAPTASPPSPCVARAPAARRSAGAGPTRSSGSSSPSPSRSCSRTPPARCTAG